MSAADAAPGSPDEQEFDEGWEFTRCPPGHVFDSSNPHAPPRRALVVIDDGLRSHNDFITRPIVSAPIHPGTFQGKPLFIANLEGAKHAAQQWPQPGRVLNLCETPLDLDCVDNRFPIPDRLPLDEADVAGWYTDTADRIHQMLDRNDWVVVNCKAGCNRSVAAVLHYLVTRGGARYAPALERLKEAKLSSARRLRFKNRYQSFDPASRTATKFSWPALCGGASTVFESVLKQKAIEQGKHAAPGQQRGAKRAAGA